MEISKTRLAILGILTGFFILTYKGSSYLVKGLSYIGVSVESQNKDGDIEVTDNNLSDIHTVTMTSPKTKVTNSSVTNKVIPSTDQSIKNTSAPVSSSSTQSPTPSQSLAPTPLPTTTPKPTSTKTPTPSPTIRVTPTPTATPTVTPIPTPSTSYPVLSVVINEIAWMGTEASYTDEWIELYNNTDSNVSLDGWTLRSETDSSPDIILHGTIGAHGYFLIERTNDSAVANISADMVSSFGKGGLNNSGEVMVLIDASGEEQDRVGVSGLPWLAGDNDSKASMERINTALAENSTSNWATNSTSSTSSVDSAGNIMKGSPRAVNSSQ